MESGNPSSSVVEESPVIDDVIADEPDEVEVVMAGELAFDWAWPEK